jgi:lipid II:glycine glycyltransferase (peptidoglycan interpeptide bridge formation enzyme)
MSQTGESGERVTHKVGLGTQSGREGGPGIAFQVSSQVHDPVWDELLQSTPGTHFEQTSGWGAVKARYGWKVLRILADVGGSTVGGVQVLTRRIGRMGKIGYVSRGPAVVSTHKDIEGALAERVSQLARQEKWLYCVFDYPYESHALAANMAAQGYFPHPAGIPPSGLLSATTVVDLRPNEDAIFARMSSSVRRNIRRGQRSPLTFALGGFADLPRFRELMLATCGRRNSAPTPPQREFFSHLWTELGKQGWVRLFLVRHGDEIVSSAFAFTQSNTIRVWKVGWSGAYSSFDPNHLMWWEIMRWAKSAGFEKLDFVWVDTEDARRAARGELTPEGFRDGTTYFKLGFGGALHFPPPVQSFFFHPLCRLGFRCGGSRLLASSLFQHLLSSYWSRVAGR